MFGNKCLGELGYEATTSAVLMAGLFLSFIVEYAGHRVVNSKVKAAEALSQAEKSKATLSTEVVSILVMEAGIIFHSLRKSSSQVMAKQKLTTHSYRSHSCRCR
jgi:solute carrier family 39 (zinc transporter), member 1/2/3